MRVAMPYNNTPVPPPKDITGAVSLPLARIKKIINVDDDISNCSNNAAFIMTIATEMFVQHLTERAYEMVKSEKRPRKNLQYNDVANAVSRIDNLEFLSDVVPRTTTFKKFVEQRGKNFKPGESSIATKSTAADVPESRSGPSQPSRHINILHPEIDETRPAGDDGTIPSRSGTLGNGHLEGDEMDVDVEPVQASTGAYQEAEYEDPVGQQLEMEMGRHGANGA
ncbi:histone-fold-containing protein [Microthyrium microscopicum]|uniref:Histone-fold-containing protein n=1 Tax=Microthyrium microscopicum TaxID=703497 RepID=A0A6A6ULB4_9PEZI|nr:histone-fold-containing protein [Microthyrium microscopicum]